MITGLSSMATRHVLAALAEAWLASGGEPVAVEALGGVEVAKRVAVGAACDFVVLAAEAIAALEAAGHVAAGSRVDVATSAIAVAVPHGAPKPALTTERDVRDAVAKATAIGYSTGPSGVYLARIFEGWGLGATTVPRLVQAPPGVPVASLLARGEASLGFQQLSELIHEEGIDIVGPLPPPLQLVTTFSAAVCAVSKQAQAARAFLAFAASDAAAGAKRLHGMEPC